MPQAVSIEKKCPNSESGHQGVPEEKPRFDGDSLLGGIGDMAVFGELNVLRPSSNPILLVSQQRKLVALLRLSFLTPTHGH
ncbi:hypothetical protein OAG53_01115 [Akkermansiaceae bacterium]|nr:hypothetical protein [Akkermansiaceae bacterium]